MQTKTKIISPTIQTSLALSSQPKKVKNFYHDEMIHNTFINNNKIPLGNIVTIVAQNTDLKKMVLDKNRFFQ